MTTSGKSKGVIRRLRVQSLVVALLGLPLAAIVGTVPDIARADVNRADCKVTAVHAKKDGEAEIPNNLQFLAEQLKDDQFAAYKSFRLLDQRSFKLERSKPGSAALKSGHTVKLELLGGEEKTLKLRLELGARGGGKALVSTAYTIADGGVLLIGGPSYRDGKLLFAVQCVGRG